jgi:hypothetical protein
LHQRRERTVCALTLNPNAAPDRIAGGAARKAIMDPDEMMEAPAEVPQLPPEMPSMLAPGEQAIPLKALAQPNDEEQVQTPAEGDSVTFSVDATVIRIEGDKAIIKASAINGTPLDEEPAESPAMDEQEGSDLRAMAQQSSM